MDDIKPKKIELEKKKITNRIMFWGGLGCIILIIAMLVLVLIFFDLINKLFNT